MSVTMARANSRRGVIMERKRSTEVPRDLRGRLDAFACFIVEHRWRIFGEKFGCQGIEKHSRQTGAKQYDRQICRPLGCA